jgi:hypothetical protein
VIKVIAVLCSLSSSANCHEQSVIASNFAEVLMRSSMMGRAPASAIRLPGADCLASRNDYSASLRKFFRM